MNFPQKSYVCRPPFYSIFSLSLRRQSTGVSAIPKTLKLIIGTYFNSKDNTSIVKAVLFTLRDKKTLDFMF